MAKKEITTVGYYKRWKALHYTLYGSKFLAPCVPAIVITSVNWNDWFVDAGASLPFGFATLLLSIIVTILAMTQKDKVMKKTISPMFYIALAMSIWAVAFMFLANILQTIGQMLLFTVAGIVAGGVIDQVDKSLASERVKEYKGLVEKNCLNKSSQKRDLRRKKAEEEARKEAANRQATE